jgi:hypothetical protein
VQAGGRPAGPAYGRVDDGHLLTTTPFLTPHLALLALSMADAAEDVTNFGEASSTVCDLWSLSPEADCRLLGGSTFPRVPVRLGALWQAFIMIVHPASCALFYTLGCSQSADLVSLSEPPGRVGDW